MDAEGKTNDKLCHALVGEHQIHVPLGQISDAEIKIAVVHHPFDWLAEFDCNRVENRLEKTCNFILHGHQHKPQVKVIHSTYGDPIVIPAGASYDRRLPTDPRYANAYNFVHLDCDNTGKGVVFLRRWSEQRTEWIGDEDSIKGGKFEFDLVRKNQRKDISIPFVIAAMTKSEATELDTMVNEDIQGLYKNFKNDLHSYDIMDWKSCYSDLRRDWEPYIYKGRPINAIITETIQYINKYRYINGETNCPKIQWVDSSQDFFEGEKGPETKSLFCENGGILIVDSISLFHPAILERLTQSEALKNESVAVLVLSPINFGMLPPNLLIRDLMEKQLHTIIDSNGKESNLGCFNEKVIRDMRGFRISLR
jgi:hypothetical protein